MIARLLYKLGDRLPCRVIHIEGKPYLERYALFNNFGLTAYLHRFVTSDDERKPHNHPWPLACSLILAGSYTEEVVTSLDPIEGWYCKYKPFSFAKLNIITASKFHRIINPEPETWTLFIHRNKSKEWGFLDKEIIETSPPRLCVIFDQPFPKERTDDWENQLLTGANNPDRTPFTGEKS
jgi:hypothetical protein